MVSMNTNSVCRTCLGSTDLWPLFPVPTQQQSFTRALYFSTGLTIEVDDGLPQKICQICANTVEDAMRFRLQSQSTEKQLQLFKDKCNVHKDNKKTNNRETIISTPGNEEIDTTSNDETYEENEECRKNMTSPTCWYYKPPEKDFYIEGDNNPSIEIQLNKEKELEKLCTTGNKSCCIICNKKFITLKCLRYHILWKHLDPKILCEYCGKICKERSGLLLHQRSKHGMARDKKLLCSLCDFNGLYHKQLEEHIRSVHTKERLFSCGVCSARFFTQPVLRQHMVVHSTERPFDCHICSKKFRLRSALTHHVHRTHTKRYKKSKCDTKKYRYGCYLCAKLYDTSYGARQHIEKIHGLPFKEQSKLIRHHREGMKAKD